MQPHLVLEAVKHLPDNMKGKISDGYHTFDELYEYRKVYNAMLFNEWAKEGKYQVHKSMWHSDGEPCFGGGWFIVIATLPTGQISNHYKVEDWGMFDIPAVPKPLVEYDGHTPELAMQRMIAFLATKEKAIEDEVMSMEDYRKLKD